MTGPTASGANSLGALLRLPLRLPGLVLDWFSHRPPVGDDGLTAAEGKEYEAQFWKVANSPAPKDARLRAEREVHAGIRQVIHLRRSR